ncbi:MAG: tetratricopeptide repeat protein [Verrucomicrobiae bacterium]|nr:tetratricopeptide repeat protein [Verrucomicrobiae bacterium]MCP5548302.1 tetratricopeptide repeat protein [Akkermansiaceae bacterium]
MLGELQLGHFEEANKELEALPAEARTSHEDLALRAEFYSQTSSWESLREIADLLVTNWPEDAGHWIFLGYATRRCRSIEEAGKVLKEALVRHGKEPLLHFNLACYAAQSGRLDDARRRLAEAIRLDPGMRKLADKDPDLDPLKEADNSV